MKIRLYMIKVAYDHTKPPDENGRLPIYSLEKGDEIKEHQLNQWNIITHFRSKNSRALRQIGIEVESDSIENMSVYLISKATKINFVYNKENNIWFQESLFKNYKKNNRFQFKENSSIIGMTSSGVIDGRVKKNYLEYSFSINVYPASLSENDYLTILNDLYSIHEQLVCSATSYTQVEGREQVNLDELEENIYELRRLVSLINTNPYKYLKLSMDSRKYSETSRFDIRAEIDRYMIPGKTKYKCKVMSETYDNQENRLIKKFLTDLYYYTEIKRSSFLSMKENLENETKEMIYYSNENINTKLELTNEELIEYLIAYKEDLDSKPSFADTEQMETHYWKLKKISTMRNKITKIEETINRLSKIKEVIDECLNLEFLKKTKASNHDKVSRTSIFINDPVYRNVWRILEKFNKVINLSFSLNNKNKVITTEKLEQIYEVWVLYKMLSILTQEMGWQIENKEIKAVDLYLSEFLREGKSLDGFKIKLMNNGLNLTIHYEPKINLINNNYLTPDFVFVFEDNKFLAKMVILDVKFRNYYSQGVSQWKKDIEEVAIKKYGNMQIADQKWQYQIINSSIVHSDPAFYYTQIPKINAYNIYYNKEWFPQNSQDEAHKYSSFFLTPAYTYPFKNWFRMIMEYKLGLYNYCWSCGEKGKIKVVVHEKNNSKKIHYTCRYCNEFWVKNHCRNRCHTIIKHTLNYHKEAVENKQWYVVCPVCEDGLII